MILMIALSGICSGALSPFLCFQADQAAFAFITVRAERSLFDPGGAQPGKTVFLMIWESENILKGFAAGF